MKRILLVFTVLATVAAFFQNCSVPNQNSMGEAADSSLTSGNNNNNQSTASAEVTLTAQYTQIYAGDKSQLIVSGGVPPYQFAVVDGAGDVDQTTGVYTAGGEAGSAVVQVMDSHSATARIMLTIAKVEVSYNLLPVHNAYKKSTRGNFYGDLAEAKGLKSSGYNYVGVVFNLFDVASSPKLVYLCKKVISSKVIDYFLWNDETCNMAVKVRLLGVLESAANSVVTVPVYQCVRISGNPMHLVTLDKATKCTAQTGYKALPGVLGYTK